jgi:hypothetical protein
MAFKKSLTQYTTLWYLCQKGFSLYILGRPILDYKEFSLFRQRLQKTRKQMASLLGTSLKAVQSFEQGWRNVPVHIERQLIFLMAAKCQISGNSRPCWNIRGCSLENRKPFPAWEFRLGNLCWFINGTFVRGRVLGIEAKKWQSEKMPSLWFVRKEGIAPFARGGKHG